MPRRNPTENDAAHQARLARYVAQWEERRRIEYEVDEDEPDLPPGRVDDDIDEVEDGE